MAVLVDADGISVHRSDRALFDRLSLTVTDGDRIGIVGINGTGKSTLLRVLAGRQEPDEGSIRRGRSVRVAFLDQEAPLPAGTVSAAVGTGWEQQALLDRLGMSAVSGRLVCDLSGGQAKRVALAAVLSQPSELLVLDEPTNHLDLPAVSWLEEHLLSRRGGLVLVSHDRHLLDRVTNRMVELDRGKAYVHDGGYAAYLDARSEREERAADAESVRRNLARRELAWLRRKAPARSRKPQARVDAARALLSSRPEAAARAGDLDMVFATPRLGAKVVEAHSATFRRGSTDVLSSVGLSLGPGERVAVVGLNGSGKSTLLDGLAGDLEPSSGTVERGPTVRVGYYRQHGPGLDLAARVRDVVSGPGRPPGNPEDNRLMERFWFTGELPWATVGTLSGGERRRLQLLVVLSLRPNVLFLDEPTNDLDLDTLRALEDFLDGWPGTLVVVSHDRAFIDRVTDRLVACTPGLGGTAASVAEVPGGLDGWLSSLTGTGGATGHLFEAPPRSSAAAAEMRKLEKEMARLSRERDRLAEKFAAASGHADLASLGEALAEAEARLSAAEERWLAAAEAAG